MVSTRAKSIVHKIVIYILTNRRKDISFSIFNFINPSASQTFCYCNCMTNRYKIFWNILSLFNCLTFIFSIFIGFCVCFAFFGEFRVKCMGKYAPKTHHSWIESIKSISIAFGVIGWKKKRFFIRKWNNWTNFIQMFVHFITIKPVKLIVSITF